MGTLRKLIYRFGFRPKPGSIFCSPSLGVIYAINDSLKERKTDLSEVERLLKPKVRQAILESFDERKIGE